MPRELRVQIVIPLPEEMFEEAATLAKAKALVEHSIKESKVLSEDATIEYEVVTPKPRTKSADPVAQYIALGGKTPHGAA